jgi:D-amino peptidase
MEGVSGLFTRAQAWYWEPGVPPPTAEEGRRLLEDDINAASAAALAAGADEVIVMDTHHGGGNIRMAAMLADPRITYYSPDRTAPRPPERRFLPGLDATVDGLLLLGHHAKAGTPGAFLPHTNHLDWADFQIAGLSVGEMGCEACFAAQWDVPVLLAQSDEAGCREAAAQFPGVITVPVKRAIDEERCEGLAAPDARAFTAQCVAEAVRRVRAGQLPPPLKPALPLTIRLRFTDAAAAGAAAQRPGVRLLDDCTVQCRVERHGDVLQWIIGAGMEGAAPAPCIVPAGYAPDLDPASGTVLG